MSLNKGTVRAKDVEAINQQDVTTIKEALALGNVDNTSDADKPISTDTQNALNDKVDKVAGQGLSDENYTLAEKDKLAGIESGAEVNTVDSVNTQRGDVVLDADDINDTTTTNKFTSQADIDRLANTSGTNTGDQDLSNYVDQADAKNLSLGENYANVKINDFVSDGFDVYPTDAGYQYAKLLQENKLNDTKVLLLPQATKVGELGANKGSNFTASRATTATRVNENGLIESVGVNVPRIDYTNGNCPSILVETQRTNLLRNSETPSNWTYTEFGSGSTGDITTGKTDKFGGASAAQIDFPADAENVKIEFDSSTNSTTLNTCSIYIKLVGNITDKIISFRSGGVIKYITISGDKFVRYDATLNRSVGESFTLKLRPSRGTSSGGFSIIICHPQEEKGTEATSYIPTTSSAVTRNADVLSNNLTGVLQPTYTAFLEITANDSRLKVEDVDTGFDIPLNGTGKIVMVVDSQITFYFPDNGQPQTTLVYEKPDDFRDLEILSKLNSNSIKLLAIENGVATQTEINNFVSGDITSYFIETDWGSKSNFVFEFQRSGWDYFPIIDTSNSTLFNAAFRENNLKNFPALNFDNGRNFDSAWLGNQLQSFPSNMFDNLTNPANNCFRFCWAGNSIDAQGVENILVSIDSSGANAPASGVDIRITTDGSALTTLATTAVANLKTKGWTITIDGVTL